MDAHGGGQTFAGWRPSANEPVNGIHRLRPDLTINSTTVNPTFRYKLGDASAGGLLPWGYGETLDLQAGAAPTYNNGSPFLGGMDDSCLFNSGGYFMRVGAQTYGDIADNADYVLEAVCKWTNAGNAYPVGKNSVFDLLLFGSGDIRFRTTGTGGQISSTLVGKGTADHWFHILVCWNRDVNGTAGLQIYINGALAGGATNHFANATGTQAASDFSIGSMGGASLYDNNVAYLASWQQASWFAGGTDAADWLAAAENRFRALTGEFPQLSEGTDLPVAARTGRSTVAYLDKIESDGTRKLYPVGGGWLRTVDRADSAGARIRGFLAEAVAENVCLQSQTVNVDGAGSPWTHTRVTVPVNSTAAPDGTTTADTLHEDATAGQTHAIYQDGLTVTAAPWVMSCFVKAGNRDWVRLRYYDLSTFYDQYYDLANGVLGATGTNTAAGIEDWGNGWYRCWMTMTSAAAANGIYYVYIATADNVSSFNGLDQDSLYVWGAQLELGTYPTSYIPTVAAAVTRNADLLEFVGDDGNLGGVGSDLAGTFECDMLGNNEDTNRSYPAFITLSDGGSATDRFHILLHPSGNVPYLYSQDAVGGAGVINISGSTDMLDGVKRRVRVTWEIGEAVFYVNGVADATDPSVATLPDNLDRIGISVDHGGTAFQLNGVISNIRIFKRAK
jgi:hypothetical protein